MKNCDIDFDWFATRNEILQHDRQLVEDARALHGTFVAFRFLDPFLLQRSYNDDGCSPYVWILPASIGGCRVPRVPGMPSDFRRVGDDDWVDRLLGQAAVLGATRLAYYGWRSTESNWHMPSWDMPSWERGRRIKTFEDLALEDPADTIHYWYWAQLHPHMVLGQQRRFVEYLDAIHFVGGIWEPARTITLDPYGSSLVRSGRHYLRFGTVSRFGEHRADCRSRRKHMVFSMVENKMIDTRGTGWWGGGPCHCFEPDLVDTSCEQIEWDFDVKPRLEFQTAAWWAVYRNTRSPYWKVTYGNTRSLYSPRNGYGRFRRKFKDLEDFWLHAEVAPVDIGAAALMPIQWF